MTALVTAANSLKALVVVRSLGKKDIPVDTADKLNAPLSAYSKYSRSYFKYPAPRDNPLDFIDSLIDIVKLNKNDVIIPVHSEETSVIAKYRPKLERYVKVPLHDYSTMMKANDKGHLMMVAKELGIPIPLTYMADNDEMLREIADRIRFPAVIKLRETTSGIGLSYVHSKDELISRYKKTIEDFNLTPGHYPLIQEYIKGDGYGVSLLFNHGELRAKFTQKRLREYPINGGPSTIRVSIKHPIMEDYAIKLMKYFNWHGVAMVEFKLEENGRPVLLEINPRFWGSVNQAVQSGVDFPYLLYKMAIEGDVETVLDYKVGIVTKNIFIDYASIYQSLKKQKNILLVKEFIQSPFNDDILSLDDPMPFFSFIKTRFPTMVSAL